jgi:N-acetylmuramic acid 6-phosphate etherase
MVRLGKTFGNLMIDVVPSNAKLKARARHAVELGTGASSDEAEAALGAARGDAKVAIVSVLAGVSADEARLRLKAAGGNVRRSLEAR